MGWLIANYQNDIPPIYLEFPVESSQQNLAKVSYSGPFIEHCNNMTNWKREG